MNHDTDTEAIMEAFSKVEEQHDQMMKTFLRVHEQHEEMATELKEVKDMLKNLVQSK